MWHTLYYQSTAAYPPQFNPTRSSRTYTHLGKAPERIKLVHNIAPAAQYQLPDAAGLLLLDHLGLQHALGRPPQQGPPHSCFREPTRASLSPSRCQWCVRAWGETGVRQAVVYA